ncbi:hypothetical protein V8G69_14885 [Gaetbulibacter sp. M235]|uniref:hypothetical protein n=1 Tax=Gaetbulibacter sp. M235 TaxID=3126510 RepID=UPI00374FA263
MDSPPLETFFNSLLPNLWEEFIFFIPNKNIPDSVIDNFKNLEIEKYFNKIMLFDTYKGPIIYEKGTNNNKIVLKGSKLENNIYRLLDRQNITSSSGFNFILEKYLEQIECLKYISRWMYENIEQANYIDETIKGLFLIQLNHFDKHVNVFVKQFHKNSIDANKSPLNVEEIIKSTLKEINRQDQGHNQNATLVVGPDNATNRTPQKTIKQPLVTEQDAEKMILKQVFNVNML